MIRLSNLPVNIDDARELREIAAEKLGISTSEILRLNIHKKSIDARKGVKWVYSLDIETPCEQKLLNLDNVTAATPYVPPLIKPYKSEVRPIVIGFGPAGIFAALTLAKAGARPIIIERGSPVEKRVADVNNFWQNRLLDENSNVLFGEGGAGTFSDGKLTTGISSPLCAYILHTFAQFGAPKEIVFLNKPHIGTDKLREVVTNIRKEILCAGGEIYFETRLCKLLIKSGAIYGVRAVRNGETLEFISDKIILATGHSARDTYFMLNQSEVLQCPKPFSIGVRIEHKQSDINAAQYRSIGVPFQPADYKLSARVGGRGVYTFCMCPGGSVVAASGERGGVVTNGMSVSARDGDNANSAVLVSITPDDFYKNSPLDGIDYQRHFEQRAFHLGGGNYNAPVQLLGDFLKNSPSKTIGDIIPSYSPGVTLCDISECLDGFIVSSLREGIKLMGRNLRGFLRYDAVLTAVETRSSSPLRILRGADFQSETVRGLYPCGEGAGYAGGIMSSAIDGINAANKVMGNQ